MVATKALGKDVFTVEATGEDVFTVEATGEDVFIVAATGEDVFTVAATGDLGKDVEEEATGWNRSDRFRLSKLRSNALLSSSLIS